MTVKPDQPLFIGDIAIAALAERGTTCVGPLKGVLGHGTKRPLAVLIRQANKTTILDIEGTPIDIENFDRRHPGQRAAFEQMVAAGSP